MSELADFYPDLLVLAGLLTAALVAAPVAKLVGLPGPAAFLGVGIAAGLAGLSPSEHLSAVDLEKIGALALYAILFQGGLATGFRAWRRSARPIISLGLAGTLVTAAALALLAHYGLRLGWESAVLIGIALAPTDPAAVYAVLRGTGNRTRARTILEGESGFNDPMGISLMVVAVEAVSAAGASTGEAAVRLAEELGIGLVGGVLGGLALGRLISATPRLEEQFQAVAVLVGALLVGAATASLHGSGFLAIYLAGLLVADRWAEQDTRHHALPESAAAVAEPVLFGLLGAAFVSLVGPDDVARGLVMTLMTALLVRPVVAAACLAGSGLRRAERALVSWGGLKGAVPLLLAGYPALERLEVADRVAAVVLTATAASILVQGATLRLVSRRV